jgi:hypothetical protein
MLAMPSPRNYSLEEALKAQSALRSAAGLSPERFPIEAFVGMISDEIESLRALGKSDDQIAAIIRAGSKVEITSDEIAANYAPPEARHQHGG